LREGRNKKWKGRGKLELSLARAAFTRALDRGKTEVGSTRPAGDKETTKEGGGEGNEGLNLHETAFPMVEGGKEGKKVQLTGAVVLCRSLKEMRGSRERSTLVQGDRGMGE